MGRRNLTDEQKTYLIGKQYEAQKKTVGGDRGNQYTKMASLQNADLANPRSRTAKIIAADHGINPSTVERASNFAHGLDTADEVQPGFRDAVLKGEVSAPKSAIADLAKMQRRI